MENFNWLVGFVFPYINLLIFIFLFMKLFKKPIISAMSSRRTMYESLVAEATKAKEEAKAKSEELDNKLANLSSEIEGIKSNAINQAKKEADSLIGDAEKLANHLKAEAKRVASAEIAAAKKELEEKLLSSAKAAVIGKLGTELSSEKQKSLAAKEIANLNGGAK